MWFTDVTHHCAILKITLQHAPTCISELERNLPTSVAPTHPILVGAPRLCPEIQQTHQTEFSREMSERCQTDRRQEALISLLKRQNLNNIIFTVIKSFMNKNFDKYFLIEFYFFKNDTGWLFGHYCITFSADSCTI